MSYPSRLYGYRFLAFAFVASALVAAGCGGNASPTAPSIPEPLNGGTFGTESTSVISGQVITGGGSSASASFGATPWPSEGSGVQVSINGTTISTFTNGNGEFLLAGVPNGTVVLHFSGAGINADLVVHGVGAHDLIQITVQAGSTSVQVINESRNKTDEFEGGLLNLGLTDDSFMLADGRTFLIGITTWWDTGGDAISFPDLRALAAIGGAVKLEGRFVVTLEGQLLATVVKVEAEDLDVEEFRLSFSRTKWSLGWVDNGSSGSGSSSIEARITGGPFAHILASSVEMEGPEPGRIVLPFATEVEVGERFTAKFTKAQAISVAASMPAGSTVEVTVRGTLVDGTPWELTGTIEISDDDDDDADDDDDGKNTVDPAVATQAIADIQVVIDYINGLVATGTMDANDAKPLITKLESAIASLQKLNGNPAVNNLESFLNQLESSEKTGKILKGDAESIEGLVEDIIKLIKGDD